MRMGGGFCGKAWMPGTWASLDRRAWMIRSTCARSDRGLSRMNMRPWLPAVLGPPAPIEDMKASTAGSSSTRPLDARDHVHGHLVQVLDQVSRRGEDPL